MAEEKPVAKRRRWRRVFRFGFVVFLSIVLIFFLAPSPIDPIAFTAPPSPPLEGVLAANELLRTTELLARGRVQGPEDVDVDNEGRVYGGCVDGRVIRILTDGKVETFRETGGRPLGMDFDENGNLIVCDADKGLLSIDPDGQSTVLSTQAGGVAFGFTDDCDVASDGKIYFSDASDTFGEGEYMLDLLEGRPHGRLLVHDPETKTTLVLLDGLYFANGVAVAPDSSYVLVNETFRNRVTRYWLQGDKAKTSETFLENLPGFPDGISTSPRGTYWIAMFTTRNPTADNLATWPWVRKQMAKLPSALWPKPAPYGLVLEVDKDGKILRSLHDVGGETISNITSVHEDDGWLYFGTLTNDYVGKWKLP